MDEVGAAFGGLFSDSAFEEISPEEISAAQNAINTGGVAAFAQYVKQHQDRWMETPLNVGFIGNSGVGKSSTINSLLGLRASDEGAAKVGTLQTTMAPTPYTHSENPNLKMWDLPGVGTPEFPRESYFQKIGFQKFDFFLVLDMMRFREEDVWIGKEIVRLEKEFFYVRTMIDNDVRNNSYDKGYDKDQTMEEIRSDIVKNLKDQGVEHAGIYLISNRDLMDFDFPRLMHDLINNFPRLKRGALALTLRAHSKEMVDQKVEVLRKRIKWAASLSAGVAAIPVPGISIVADIAVIVAEINFYYDQLGLKPEALRQLGLITGVDPSVLISTASKIYPTTMLSSEAVKTALKEIPLLAVETLTEEATKWIPMIGSVISSFLSFGTMMWFLNHSLNQMHQAATEVLKEALTKHVVGS